MHASSGGASAGDAGHLPASFAPQNCRPKVPKVDPPPAGAHARKPCEQAGRMGGRGKGNDPEGIHAGLPPHISQPFLSPSFPSPPQARIASAHGRTRKLLSCWRPRRPAGGQQAVPKFKVRPRSGKNSTRNGPKGQTFMPSPPKCSTIRRALGGEGTYLTSNGTSNWTSFLMSNLTSKLK